MYKLACKFNDEIIFYFDAAGNKYVASGGNLAWRLNNPGLIRSHSSFSYINNAIGSCDGYAIFSSPAEGRKALVNWLRLKKYFNASLKTIAEHYQKDAPKAFLDELVSFTKIPPKIKIKTLNEQEFDRLVIGIGKLCGYSRTGNESFIILPKIIAKIENGKNKEESYLVGENTLLSKEEATQWVLSHRLDAVVAHERGNKLYLRSRPNYSFQKIKVPAKSWVPPEFYGEEIETLVRRVGEKRPRQCIWGFINGIGNTKEDALASAALISKYAGGGEVLSMPNDTINKAVDFIICLWLKAHAENRLVAWTVFFLRYLIEMAKLELNPVPVVVFAHSQGAIYIEHAIKLMGAEERELLHIFTFGGGSFIPQGMSHSDSHNYVSAADFVPHFGSPKLQSLALHRYYGLKSGLTDQQVVHQLAYEDAILNLDSLDPKTLETYTKSREQHYEQEFSKIKHITILDPDLGSNWKHKFASDCYQATVQAIVMRYWHNG